jgi:phage head maturation protease
MRIAGYAAIFDVPDRGGDIVRRGAFAGAKLAGVPLLWQHDPRRAAGVIEHLSEDARGLRLIARLGEGEVAPGHGLSFGYRVRAAKQGTYRELEALELIEVSLVKEPMQPLAVVHAVEL